MSQVAGFPSPQHADTVRFVMYFFGVAGDIEHSFYFKDICRIQTLFTFLGFKRKFHKSLSGAISTFRWNKRCGESGYSGARDLMAVSFNQEKPFFSSAIIWQEIWMDFSKLER